MPVKCIPHNRPEPAGAPASAMGRAFSVRLFPMNRTVEAREGQRILELCEENLIPLETRCGGNCACSSCRVIVLGGDDHLSPQEDDELTQLEEAEASTAQTRLACQARIHGDVDIEIPGLR